jgi:hypothetical protein
VADFLGDKRSEIEARLDKLRPAVEEYGRLQQAAQALASVGETPSAVMAPVATPVRRGRPSRPRGTTSTTATTAAPRKKRGRPPGRKKVGRPKRKVGRPSSAAVASDAAASTARATGGRGRGRRKGSGARSAQALSLVQGQPGITIPELAAKMGIKHNYLYRVLPALEQEGKVTKQGRGWLPRAS